MGQHQNISNMPWAPTLLATFVTFTYCFQFGVVPTNFTKGILIPLFKKPSLDPTLCKNYRPIIVSTAFSKLAELCILDECNECTFSDLQFGFVKGRGTDTALLTQRALLTPCHIL